MTAELKKVRGKEGILFKLADAAIGNPRTTLRSSYSSYYRQMLPPLLRTLGLRCNNTAYRPVMDAMKLLEKYAEVDGKTRFYDGADTVPMDGVVA
ncbi:hypothetical protein [Streptomyces sp. NPDC004362]|uniref:hypothetical protein n=1 Tax=unclassified Streptomyces TaxID=2593676 RepID=UPI0033AF61CA